MGVSRDVQKETERPHVCRGLLQTNNVCKNGLYGVWIILAGGFFRSARPLSIRATLRLSLQGEKECTLRRWEEKTRRQFTPAAARSWQAELEKGISSRDVVDVTAEPQGASWEIRRRSVGRPACRGVPVATAFCLPPSDRWEPKGIERKKLRT